jgi:transmembrane sensor
VISPGENHANRSAAEEAVGWFLELAAHTPSADQQEAFADWLCRSPVHVEEFLRLTATQADLAQLGEIKNMDVEELITEFRKDQADDKVIALSSETTATTGGSSSHPRARARARAPRLRKRGFRRGWRPRFTMAAISVILVSLVLTFVLQGVFGQIRYATGLGEQLSVHLKDGSLVQINARSTLRAKVNGGVRDLHLPDGEALFRVAKDRVHPFRVYTPQAIIEAKGTQFNVNVIDETTVVTLLEGHVLVSAGKTSVTLSPGEQVSITGTSGPSKPRIVDAAAVAAWTQHRLVFEDARLSDVIAEFNRFSPQPFVIEDPALRDLRITASFDTGSVQSFIDSLVWSGEVRITRRERGDNLISRP